jgi:hypothetical protein
MQLFVDMDGVLADFDRHHAALFGTRPCRNSTRVDWKAVHRAKDFFLGIPPMADLEDLWARIERHRPIVLTGIPVSVPEAEDNKRTWVRAHLGENVEVRTCLAREKYLHASPGDVLIDDWEKFRQLWIDAGGRWITHVSAADTDRALAELGL